MMIKYKKIKYQGEETQTILRSDGACIPFDPQNTDFVNFKKEILADEAQLQDADGNVMADAKNYVRTLP